MLFARTSPDYDEAVSSVETVTQRLRCVNRELASFECPVDPLDPSVRRKVGLALRNHCIRCEGMPDDDPQLSMPLPHEVF